MTEATSPVHPLAGRILGGKYQLKQPLGAGGMSVVFEGENTWTHRRVAIKILSGDLAKDEQANARFMREAQAASRVEHPNIVSVLDVGQETDGSLYIVQEFLSGHDLGSLLEQRTRISIREAFEIMLPVMSALEHAHEHGVVHRDIKPENIFLARLGNGRVSPKIIDFGISKLSHIDSVKPNLTRTGTIMGTPAYMSPEQARGASNIDRRTDVWSVGVVLYELIAGRCPYVADNYNLMVVQILTEPVPSLRTHAPEVSEPIARLLSRALSKNVEERPEMGQFVREIAACPEIAALGIPEEMFQLTATSDHAVPVRLSMPDTGERVANTVPTTPGDLALSKTSVAHNTASELRREPSPSLVTTPPTTSERAAPPPANARWKLIVGAVLGAVLVAGSTFALTNRATPASPNTSPNTNPNTSVNAPSLAAPAQRDPSPRVPAVVPVVAPLATQPPVVPVVAKPATVPENTTPVVTAIAPPPVADDTTTTQHTNGHTRTTPRTRRTAPTAGTTVPHATGANPMRTYEGN